MHEKDCKTVEKSDRDSDIERRGEEGGAGERRGEVCGCVGVWWWWFAGLLVFWGAERCHRTPYREARPRPQPNCIGDTNVP